MKRTLPTIAVLGASGLIGEAIASWLLREGFRVVAIARRFNRAQSYAFGAAKVECPIVSLDVDALARIFNAHRIDIVCNCIGILQDGHGGSTDEVHRAFVDRLVKVLGSRGDPQLLIHLSVPGSIEDDRTRFSRTKRVAERVIADGRVPFVILRPGFVVASSAYGGGAALRALAMLPFGLPVCEAAQVFRTVDVLDIARTVAFVAYRWCDGKRDWCAVWDVMTRQPTTVGDVIDAFKWHLGGPKNRLSVPAWLMELTASASDLVAYCGWCPPLRSTALLEMRRGVRGDPELWIQATGIEPASLSSTLERAPASVQDKWFTRLYFLKALILASLVMFWSLSGLIALTVAFDAAVAILTSHGFSLEYARAITATSSLFDIAIGIAIAFKRTCRTGLLVGIGLSLFYMAAAMVIIPEMWAEPLGALLKTGPAIVLMMVALVTLADR